MTDRSPMPADRTSVDTPLSLSVVMLNYNHGHYIREALEAILNQSRNPAEVIVVDDASTDNSVEVIREIARENPSVRLLRNDRNRDVYYSGTRGMRAATGTCIFWAAADDRVLPGLFEKSLAMLERYPQAGLCCSLRQLLDIDGAVVQKTGYVYRPASESAFLTPSAVRRILERHGLFIGGALYRKSAVSKFLPWRPELKAFVDGFAAHSIALEHGACFIPEVLASKRLTPGRISQASKDDPDFTLDWQDCAIRLMENDYAHLWPERFVRDYRQKTSCGLGVIARGRLRMGHDDAVHVLERLRARRPTATFGVFLLGLRMMMRIMEWGLGIYVKVAYPPRLLRIPMIVMRKLKRGT